MSETEKLRVLLVHWIGHNDELADNFRRYTSRAGEAGDELLEAGRLLAEANAKLCTALDKLGGPLEYQHA